MHRSALAIRRKALGEEHPHTAVSYNNLAGNLAAQGKYAEAEAMHRRALAILLKALGEDHPDTATSYNNLAATLRDQGKYAEAEAMHRRALAIRLKALREGHPDIAPSYSNLADSLDRQGKHDEALQAWQLGRGEPRAGAVLRPQGARGRARGRLTPPRPRRRPGPRRPAARGLGELGARPGPRHSSTR